MTVDGLVVSFGLATVLMKLRWLGGMVADALFGALAAMVVALAAYSLVLLRRENDRLHAPTRRSEGASATAVEAVASEAGVLPSGGHPPQEVPET